MSVQTDLLNKPITTVVNIKKVNGRRPFFNIYIGRKVENTEFTVDSKWSNPFRIEDSYDIGVRSNEKLERSKIIHRYEVYIREKIKEDPVKYNIEELRGKILGCWCKPKSCHGDVLIKLLKEKDEEIWKEKQSLMNSLKS